MTIALNSPGKPRTLHVRIPAWAANASASVNGGKPTNPPNGTVWVIRAAESTSVVINLSPSVRLEHWYGNGATSVHRGALMYSIPLVNNSYTVTANYSFESRDYNLVPTEPWRWALVVDESNPSKSLVRYSPGTALTSVPLARTNRRDAVRALQMYSQPGYVNGAIPFNHTGWPAYINAEIRSLPGWATEKGSAAAPPPSPACSSPSSCGPAVAAKLVPHGGTDLRIGEIPVA